MYTPTVNGGYPLTPGDEVGRELPPECCEEEMNRTTTGRHLVYRCASCHTALEVNNHGLVLDIRD
jgi:predicted RNA-binding Zn-ribbon protein involved in translation (DUF1610 family)